MDGMTVIHHRVSTGGPGENSVSNTIRLPAPTSVVAEISVASFTSFGSNVDTFCAFTACTTNGADGFPTSESSGVWSWRDFSTVLIRNGLTSVSYEIDIANCSTSFIVNLFFWPTVVVG